MKKCLLAIVLLCATQSTLPMGLGAVIYAMGDMQRETERIRYLFLQVLQAAQDGDLAGIKKQLTKSIWVNHNFRDLPEKALSIAARHGHNEICEFLLEQGAQPHLFNLLGVAKSQTIPTIIYNYIVAPHKKTIRASDKNVFTFLLCMKQYKPALPKDVQLIILSYLEDMGNLMIGEAFAGKEIPKSYLAITHKRLFDITMQSWTSTKNEHLQAAIALLRQEELANKLHTSICNRLANKPFKCNGTEPDPNPNESFCIIS